MRAIFIDIQRPLDSKLVDPVNSQSLGGMVMSVNTKLTKPRRDFSIRSWDNLLASQIELLRSDLHGSRSGGVFWFDGDVWSNINEPMFVANGNGSQLQFQLPVDNVFPSSCKFWDNQTLVTDWTMNSDPAIVTFTSAPTGRITFIGKRKFRIMMADNQDTLLSESQLWSDGTDGVYSMQPINFVEVEAVSVA